MIRCCIAFALGLLWHGVLSAQVIFQLGNGIKHGFMSAPMYFDSTTGMLIMGVTYFIDPLAQHPHCSLSTWDRDTIVCRDTVEGSSQMGTKTITNYKGKLHIWGGKSYYHNMFRTWDGNIFEVIPGWSTGVIGMMREFDDTLYLTGGNFDTVGGIPATGIIRWDGQNYSPFHMDDRYSGSIVHDIARYKGAFYICGRLKKDGISHSVLRLENGEWYPVPNLWDFEFASSINSMVVFNGLLYLTGYFRKSAGSLADDIVAYDGTYFYEMPNQPELFYGNKRLVIFNGKLLVLGAFYELAGHPAHFLATWDPATQQWCNLGNYYLLKEEIDSSLVIAPIHSIGIHKDTIYIYGTFNRVARLNSTIRDTVEYLAALIYHPDSVTYCSPPAPLKKITGTGTAIPIPLKDMVKIYPNPAQEYFTVEVRNPGNERGTDWRLNLFDVTGKAVKSETFSNSTHQVTLVGLARGMYIITILDPKGRFTWEGKVVKF